LELTSLTILLQNEVKPDKMKKIVWPEARGLIEMLLEEKVEDRPKSWDEVISHPFLDTDNSAALAALMNKMDTLNDGQTRAEQKLDVIGSDVKEVKQHVGRVLVGLKAVQDTIVNLDASPIPTVFVVEPEPTLAESTLEQAKAGEIDEAHDQVSGVFNKFKSVFDASSPMEAVQSAIDEFSSKKMTLRLVCQYTGEPVGDGYEITAPRELVPKLLPLMSAGLKAMKAVNGVTRIGRLFGLPLPEVPEALQDKLETMIDGLGAGESGFACVAEAAGEAVKGDSAAAKTELSRFQLREFEAFLNDADPDGFWRCATPIPAFGVWRLRC